MTIHSKPRRADSDDGQRPVSVAVLAKAVGLLEHLADEGETTPAHLSGLIGEPRSTVYRLLRSLQDLGYVEPSGTRGSYRLSLKVFTLGSAVMSRFDERQAALPVMERLHEETGETIFLCVRRGSEAVCIERIDGARVTVLELSLGGALPLHLGAAPRALLAFEPEETWQEYVSQMSHEARAPNTPVSANEVLDELRETRQRGLAISDQDVTLGVAAVGAPVLGHLGTVRASLSVAGMREVILGHGSRVSDLVLEAAHEASRSLGYPSGRLSERGSM